MLVSTHVSVSIFTSMAISFGTMVKIVKDRDKIANEEVRHKTP